MDFIPPHIIKQMEAAHSRPRPTNTGKFSALANVHHTVDYIEHVEPQTFTSQTQKPAARTAWSIPFLGRR